ncbi:trypsinogen-like protein 3 [Oryzias melastigma]|uniref:Trypsinogen-like protein 3 n=1 Tax=Oryzias melastigma TaxID=30732 RepID=A0A3B3CE40_ORYME|nr:trypsinogen-like protein 3 [Oryzias melastigma]
MNFLLLAVILGLAGALPLQDSKECRPHSQPWHVILRSEGRSCSGALIDPRWIVTSFACATSPYNTIATLGEHDLSVAEGTEQDIVVSDVIQHGPYRSPLHSLTLMRLSQPARITPYVQPIPLPSRCALPGEICSVSGWGTTDPDQSNYSPRLKCITVPVVDDQTCVETFPEYLYWGVMVCAGQNNTDNCLSGSSTVMVCDGQLQGLKWFDHGCSDPAHPTVYSEMCKYNGWIKSMMENYAPNFQTTTTLGSTNPPGL